MRTLKARTSGLIPKKKKCNICKHYIRHFPFLSTSKNKFSILSLLKSVTLDTTPITITDALRNGSLLHKEHKI